MLITHGILDEKLTLYREAISTVETKKVNFIWKMMYSKQTSYIYKLIYAASIITLPDNNKITNIYNFV
jgi:hypothetical protein